MNKKYIMVIAAGSGMICSCLAMGMNLSGLFFSPIAAELGTQVRATADGVVEEVYNDDLYGTTVIIAHSGGLKSTAYQQALHTFNAAKYTHMATTQNFELAFRTTYAAVADYQQVLKASESALEYQKASYAATELKYRQGSISKNALLTAQDELATAENTVLTAKHNLFTAYHNYLWAVEHGIMN